jgi:peptidyl-tRNA hydrolase
MSDTKFKIGQVVTLDRRAGDGHIPAGEFTVTCVMPLESGLRS